MKKLYRVVASQLVFHECFIEAESLEDAEELAWEGDSDWKEFAYGDWELEDVILAKVPA
jgi:hypothetical protein